MEWRERDGVRWLEADLPGARARASRPGSAASASGAVRQPQPRHPHRRRPDAVLENRAPARRGARARPRAGPDRPPGPRRRDRSSTSAPQDAEPVRRARRRPARGRRPRHRRAGPGAAGLRRRLPAGRPRGPGRRGDAPLRLARARGRHRRRGAEAVGATAAAIGPGIGPCCYEVGEEVLAAFAASARGSPTGRMLDLPEAAPPAAGRAGVERVEAAGLCTSCEPELFFSHRRDGGRDRPPGRHRLDRRAADGRADPRHRPGTGRAPTSSEVASGRRGGGRDPGRDQVRAARGDGRAGRGRGRRWSARTASRTSPPSTSAGATPSTWDFIGNLQSRKVKQMLPLCRLIHSVATDSVLAQLERHGDPGDRGPGRGQRRRRGGQGRGRARRARRLHRRAARSGSSA